MKQKNRAYQLIILHQAWPRSLDSRTWVFVVRQRHRQSRRDGPAPIQIIHLPKRKDPLAELNRIHRGRKNRRASTMASSATAIAIAIADAIAIRMRSN